MSKAAYVDPIKCDRSPLCPSKRSCPEKAITQEKLGFLSRGPAYVNPDLCVACGVCIKSCPHGAVSFKGSEPGQKKKKKKTK
ncbi:4Fe-4S dicluster domain-containing protein [Desulfitobacterium metallireducens]|uniref:4Fe-4S ferredoxin n=1 Tax=Desulfitobacterium metallireducens DSM 15288 TaxID=871968 RepID=W0EBC2_9FIRM|nr:4Fe-4S binding protein [Desulfitobacterium metallireducens]AHF06514.1 4Fe-4S ferredoxin [Desulfitobacterium metallireducens DSM 15288]